MHLSVVISGGFQTPWDPPPPPSICIMTFTNLPGTKFLHKMLPLLLHLEQQLVQMKIIVTKCSEFMLK